MAWGPGGGVRGRLGRRLPSTGRGPAPPTHAPRQCRQPCHAGALSLGAPSGVPPPYPSRPWSIRYVVLNLDLKYSQHPTTGNPSPPAPPSHRDREGWPAPRRPRTRPGPGPEACRRSCSWGPAVPLRLPGKSHITYPARLTWAPPWGPLGGRPQAAHPTYPAKGRKHESLPDARQLRL